MSTWVILIYRMHSFSVSARRITMFCLYSTSILSIAVINSLLIVVLEFWEWWLFCMSGLLWPWEDSLLPYQLEQLHVSIYPSTDLHFHPLLIWRELWEIWPKQEGLLLNKMNWYFFIFLIVILSPTINHQYLNILS